MSAAEPDDLERRLTELFNQRAATVTQVRPIDLGPAGGTRKPAEPGPASDHRHRHNLGVLAAAAAVFVAIAGTVLGIQAHRPQPAAPPPSVGSHPDNRPTSNPTATSTDKPSNIPCFAAATPSWQRAITAGAVPLDRQLNQVISANGSTGEYLVVQGNPAPPGSSAVLSDVEVSLFHGSTGRTIYLPAEKEIVSADPTGAISADWVTFALSRTQNLLGYRVLLYDRRSQQGVPLADDSRDVARYGFIGSPVIAAGKVYWLATTYGHPETTRLESWDLARRANGASVPAPDATGLVSYGSGVALIRAVGSTPR